MVRLFGIMISEATKARDQEVNVSKENFLQLPRVAARRGKSWTKEEHGRFLEGLRQLGKGDWKGISARFVKSKSATQVASHVQKYLIRQNNQSNWKKRSRYDPMPSNEPQPKASIAQSTGKQVQENQNANPTNSTSQLVLEKSSSNPSQDAASTSNQSSSSPEEQCDGELKLGPSRQKCQRK